MSNIAELNSKLDQMIASGKVLEAFEEFYADDCTMQENTEPPTVGKDANRQREIAFIGSIEAFHRLEILSQAAHGDVSFTESAMDATIKGVGRIEMSQVAVRHWKHGKVVRERFYHK